MVDYDRNRDPMAQNGGAVPVDLPSDRDRLIQAYRALKWLAYHKLGPLPTLPGRPDSVDVSAAFEGMPEHVRDALKTSIFQR